GVGLVQFVLSGAGQSDVAGNVPQAGAGAGDERDVLAASLGVLGDSAAAALLDFLEQGEVDALLVDDVAVGVGAGHHSRAELLGLLDRVDRDIARTRDHDALSVEGLTPAVKHLGGEEYAAVPGRLGARLGAAPAQALSGEDSGLVTVGDSLVLAEQV